MKNPTFRLLGATLFLLSVAMGTHASAALPGSLDLSFDPGSSIDGPVYAIVQQGDGRWIIGGGFRHIDGHSRGGVARLNENGELDPTFVNASGGVDGVVHALTLQSDGKILIGGDFSAVHGTPRNGIARLHDDGSLDETFGPGLGGANARVRSVVLQDDGRVLIGGDFTEVNGVARNRIARLNADGTLDSTVGNGSNGANDAVWAIALQSDGKILIGGSFTTVNGSPAIESRVSMPMGHSIAPSANGKPARAPVSMLSPSRPMGKS